MARSLAGFLVLLLFVSTCEAASLFQPISDFDRSAALELFAPDHHGYFKSLEETYEALRTFQILGIEKKPYKTATVCRSILETIGSSSSTPKDLFYALKANSIAECKINEKAFQGIITRLKAALYVASSLFDFYYSIGGLVLIKDQSSKADVDLAEAEGVFRSVKDHSSKADVDLAEATGDFHSVKALGQSDGRWRSSSNSPESSAFAAGIALETLAGTVSLASSKHDQSSDQSSKADVHLADAEGVFHSVEALSQSDGRWRYSSDSHESSAFAAGIALEILAGIISLASSELDQSSISSIKHYISKLFDSIEKYDDQTLYFDDKLDDGRKHQDPLSTTASVVRGLTSFAAVTAGSLNLPGDKILGLANFFLRDVVPGDTKDFFNQIDSLAFLESSRISIPLILSLPSTVLSLSKKDSLKVRVKTLLSSNAPPLTVKLVGAVRSGAKEASLVESQELKFDAGTGVHILNNLPKSIDIGSYTFAFEIVLHESEHEKVYVTGSQTKVPVSVMGLIEIENAEITVLDSDLGSIETQKKLDLAGQKAVSISANHLQKLRLSFQLTTPRGHALKPHQALLKLRHESMVEHIFVVGNSGKQFEILLNFLGLVEKFFYLSGRYDIELTVGDAVMENSFLRAIGHIELDLPEAPEKAPRPPPRPVDPYIRYGPKAEITHIYRAPETHPPKEHSLAFLVFTLLPLLGFLIGLLRLGVNLKNFPTKAVPATFAILFHGGLGAVLLLYVLFWLKLDLIQAVKLLCFLGVFLTIVGHRVLSHLAATSAKSKSA